MAYPAVSLPKGLDEGPYLEAWPVSPEEVRRLAEPLRSLIPLPLPLLPGTDFGPLVGKARGRFGDFRWSNLCTPLVSCRALERLKELGVKGLVGVKPQIALTSKGPFDYVELHIEPYAQLDPSCLTKDSSEPCPRCGISRGVLIDEDLGGSPVVLQRSLPPEKDLVRVVEMEGCVLATERFVEAALRLRLADIVLDEVRTV